MISISITIFLILIVLINSFDSCSARENPTVQEAVGASGYVRLGQQGPPK